MTVSVVNILVLVFGTESWITDSVPAFLAFDNCPATHFGYCFEVGNFWDGRTLSQRISMVVASFEKSVNHG